MNNIIEACTLNMPILAKHIDNMLNNTMASIYCKSKEGRYLESNQSFLQIAGVKNCQEIIGKTDFDFWEKEAPFMIENDNEVMSSNTSKYIIEPTKIKNNIVLFASYKVPIRSNHGKVIGVLGQSIPLDQQQSVSQLLNKFPLSPNIENNSVISKMLSKRQIQCLHYVGRGKTSKQIAKILNLSYRTIEFYINILKMKLKCSTRSELIEKAWEFNV